MKKLLLSQLLVLGLFMFLPHSVDAQYLALEYATQFHPLGRSVILQLASERARQTTLVCEDKQLKALWRKMMGSQAFKTYVDIGNYSKINKIDCANEFEVRLIDVNNDGTKEIAVKGKWAGNFCGMYSGCSFWLFQKSRDGYRSLISYGNAFDFKLGRKKRRGFRDLILSSNHGNYGVSRYFYQFNGSEYKAKRCYLESFIYYDNKGQSQTGEKLNITSDDCPKDEN